MSFQISFKFNKEKAIEAMLYALSKRPSIGLYNLVKIMFEADKIHLKKNLRPVTGDVYIAMRNGTVPSHIYDIIKREASSAYIERSNNILSATREPNLDLLSESDQEALDKGVEKYADLSFQEVYDTNHKESCWNTTKRNKPISFEKIIEDEEVISELHSILKSGLRSVI